MSRNTQYEFVNADSDSLVSSLVAIYEQMVGITVRPSSPEKAFIQWVANILLIERAHINKAGNSNIPSRAEGDDLNTLGETIFGISRPAAKPSTTSVRFRISEAQAFNILIPKGTRVTDSNQSMYWSTDRDVYISPGNVSAEIPCTCETAGTEGNGYEAGQINTIVDVFEYYQDCVNLTASDGGSDEATDDEYYDIMKKSLNSWSTAGARGSYSYHAKQVSTEISDVIAKQPTPGYVYIYVLMNDGSIASEEIKEAVYAACNDDYVRPLTDHVSVMDGEVIPYNINFTYYIPRDTNKSAIQMANDVQEAVNKYVAWQQSKFGRDINPDKLRDYVLDVGIKRLEVVEPVFTVLNDGSAEDSSIPQVTKVGRITITNGGYEDE